ncbi:6-phosphogluconolactonase [Alphaproteobacteria bacterium]|nr:6-phosphogluconolactonase [Alphaproteobacteria bacterium]
MMIDSGTVIADYLSKAIAARGSASLVVSGGSSPVPTFKTLATLSIDWAKVTITLVDDRDVAADHADSNDLLVHTHLLQGHAAEAQFISLARDTDAVSAIARPFDVMLLGMGTDGHFASLFPDMMADQVAFDPDTKPVILRTGVKGSPAHPRISMNLAMILQSRHIMLLIQGDAKRAVLAEAQQDRSLPVSALLHQTITKIDIITDQPS